MINLLYTLIGALIGIVFVFFFFTKPLLNFLEKDHQEMMERIFKERRR